MTFWDAVTVGNLCGAGSSLLWLMAMPLAARLPPEIFVPALVGTGLVAWVVGFTVARRAK